jgi:hypothetical protein
MSGIYIDKMKDNKIPCSRNTPKYHAVGTLQNTMQSEHSKIPCSRNTPKYHAIGTLQSTMQSDHSKIPCNRNTPKYHAIGTLQNRISKSWKDAKSVPLAHTYMTADFPGYDKYGYDLFGPLSLLVSCKTVHNGKIDIQCNFFCSKVSFLTSPHRHFRGRAQGMMYIVTW